MNTYQAVILPRGGMFLVTHIGVFISKLDYLLVLLQHKLHLRKLW